MLDHLSARITPRGDVDEPMGDQTLYDAIVQRQVTDPSAEVLVSISDLDDGRSLVPCRLGAGPRTLLDGSVVLPTKGDAATVMVSSEGDHWITAWTPGS